MGEIFNLRDIDIIGLITLNEVQGIEKYVTPVKKDGKIETYLSRSKEYYNVKSITELALEREELKSKLTRELTKRNFVILENMLNCSGRVYYKKFEEFILNERNSNLFSELEEAKSCMMEDVTNILVILQKKGLINVSRQKILPTGEENVAKRAIEMDNKAILYTFCKSLNITKKPDEVEVLTPGYGSVYIGPFLKAMYGYDFTNILKSKYIKETFNIGDLQMPQLTTSDRIFEPSKTVLLLDDNIGTGATMHELQKELINAGQRNFVSGAVQYNWRNYFNISIGEKQGTDRFEIKDFDIITPINYAGHKLYKHAIDILHSSGAEYIDYLNSKSYRLENCSDTRGALNRGLICANWTGLRLTEDIEIPKKDRPNDLPILEQYENGPYEVTNPISKAIIRETIKNVNAIENNVKEEEKNK